MLTCGSELECASACRHSKYTRLYGIKKRFKIVLKTTMVEVLDDGGNAMANAMQSSDIAKDIKRVMLNILLGFRYFYDKT